MRHAGEKNRLSVASRVAVVGLLLLVAAATRPPLPPASDRRPPAVTRDDCPEPHRGVRLDCSGRTHAGVASFYANRFGGRPMADGTPMNLQGDNAASRTLPLGTIALVTNLETGITARITIRDRGPYVAGRIIDLSPATARKIGISERQGLAFVAVAPVLIPLPDGRTKSGAAATRRS